MAKVNLVKAKRAYLKAQQQEFIDEITNIEITETTEELLKSIEEKYNLKEAHVEQILGYSKGTLAKWKKDNTRREVLFWALKGIRRYYYTYHTTLKLGLDEDGECEDLID